jgi:YVTN family beta-propeller protein
MRTLVVAGVLLLALLTQTDADELHGFPDETLKDAREKHHLPEVADPSAIQLRNGWKLTPSGRLIELSGDMPLKIVTSADGRQAFVVTGGFHDHGLEAIDIGASRIVQRINLGKAWAGLALDEPGGVLYVAGGGPAPESLGKRPDMQGIDAKLAESLSLPVLRLALKSGQLAAGNGMIIPGLNEKDRFTAGLATTSKALFVANTENDTIYKLDPDNGGLQGSAKVGYRPYQIATSPDGMTVAVGEWGDGSVLLLRTTDLSQVSRIKVGVHPTDVAYGPDGRLFVASAGSDSVSIIHDGRVAETVRTELSSTGPIGATPCSLAVSRDGRRLYVANSGENDVAVIDIAHPGHAAVLGFIPTGEYPSAVAVTPDGGTLVIGVAKGLGSAPNVPVRYPAPRTQADPKHPFNYIGWLVQGYAEIVRVPGTAELARYTDQARGDIPSAQPTEAEVRDAETAFRHIKHVVYVIRENRTYDQVFGDDGRGDGDPELAIFGEAVTPNGHELERRTVLLDHYFVNGEVSENGHEWANAAYSTAFTERTTASHYGGRGEPDADERLSASPAGYLWDAARRKGLSYISYGEYASFTSSPSSAPVFEGEKGLEGHASRAWSDAVNSGARDYEKIKVFTADLVAAEESGAWLSYMVVYLPENHTFGLTPGQPTPKAAVASNDLALGMLVQAVSHSRFWDSTAIFVTEDDAQDGPDHLDEHRSVALVISPYVKPGYVDQTSYSMMSMLRTMELILGLPPLTQYDLHARPMYTLFQPTASAWRYDVVPETEDLAAVNPKDGPLAKASARLDFSKPDRADPQELNAILWAALRPGKPYPAPTHRFPSS